MKVDEPAQRFPQLVGQVLLEVTKDSVIWAEFQSVVVGLSCIAAIAPMPVLRLGNSRVMLKAVKLLRLLELGQPTHPGPPPPTPVSGGHA